MHVIFLALHVSNLTITKEENVPYWQEYNINKWLKKNLLFFKNSSVTASY